MHQNNQSNRIKDMLIQPRADLYDRIINKINREEKLMVLKKRLMFNALSLTLSFFVFIPLTIKLLSDVARSGLTQYLSLLFSDFNLIMANVGDYVLTILESAPALSMSLALAALLVLVFSLAKLADSYGDFKKTEKYYAAA